MSHPPAGADCEPIPTGEPVLYLRGGLNNWAALDEFAFTYSCDAYYVNVKLTGHQEFKIADESWTPQFTYGAKGGGATVPANAAFGLGRPYHLDSLPLFPRRDPPISCDEWRRRVTW